MLHRSETWPVRKENVVALQRAEMRMVRWMYGVKLKDRFTSKELRERLGMDDIALVMVFTLLVSRHQLGHMQVCTALQTTPHHSSVFTGNAIQCFDAVGWAAGRASGL